ncbi:MAG: ATP-grasp domain-containing protein [Halioglobus sp.]|nr:ATP-grasp domain-containing protein [Halioglobus sp.]
MPQFVLIVGYRQQLAQAVHKLGIPYSIVAEKPIRTTPKGADEIAIMPFDEISPGRGVPGLSREKTPTHVIAGTEAGVFPAAQLRRTYGARRSSQTLLTRCTDKLAMKSHLSKRGIPMGRFVVHASGLTAEELVARLGLPVVVKDRQNSGGRNVVIARTLAQLRPLLGPQRLYEEFLDAPEGSIESIVQDGEILFTSTTEYRITKFANIVPAGYPREEIERIQLLNREVIKAMNIKWGLTHLEYYRKPGSLLFGEIALRPPGGYIMELIRGAYDFDPWDAFVRVELGLDTGTLPEEPRQVCGTVLLHPGEGIVSSISHPDNTNFSTLSRVSIKVKAGDRVHPRIGVGEDVGHCVFSAKNYADVVSDVEKMCQFSPVELRAS